MLLTELHLSRSTLLMLIAGPERIKGRRRPHAAGYRFFSYGDVCSSNGSEIWARPLLNRAVCALCGFSHKRTMRKNICEPPYVAVSRGLR